MKATTQIQVTVEIEDSDAARLYNVAALSEAKTDRDHEEAGRKFRAELQEVVNRAVRTGIGAYISATL